MGIPQDQIISLNKSRQRAIYWRQIGGHWLQTGLIPADPASIQRYFARGFRAKKPEGNGEEVETKTEGTIKCPICGFAAQGAFGLQAHLRKHTKKEGTA